MCQHLAITNSGLAQVIQDQRTGRPVTCTKSAADAKQARHLAHEYAADDARNRSAGESLELYFKLAAAEAGADLYRAGAADLEKLLADARKTKAAGFKIDVDVADLESQLADAKAEASKLDGSVKELNASLKVILGQPAEPGVHYWPEPLRVEPTPLDAEEAVRVGLHLRPDLCLLRSILLSPNASAAETAEKLLAAVNPLLGSTPGGPSSSAGPIARIAGATFGLLVRDTDAPCATMRQVSKLLAERERQAEAEIRAAVDRVASATDQARIYSELAATLKKRVDALEKEDAAGRAVTSELARTKALWRKAVGNLTRSASEYETALARLKQAQGLLVREGW